MVGFVWPRPNQTAAMPYQSSATSTLRHLGKCTFIFLSVQICSLLSYPCYSSASCSPLYMYSYLLSWSIHEFNLQWDFMTLPLHINCSKCKSCDQHEAYLSQTTHTFTSITSSSSQAPQLSTTYTSYLPTSTLISTVLRKPQSVIYFTNVSNCPTDLYNACS